MPSSRLSQLVDLKGLSTFAWCSITGIDLAIGYSCLYEYIFLDTSILWFWKHIHNQLAFQCILKVCAIKLDIFHFINASFNQDEKRVNHLRLWIENFLYSPKQLFKSISPWRDFCLRFSMFERSNLLWFIIGVVPLSTESILNACKARPDSKV